MLRPTNFQIAQGPELLQRPNKDQRSRNSPTLIPESLKEHYARLMIPITSARCVSSPHSELYILELSLSIMVETRPSALTAPAQNFVIDNLKVFPPFILHGIPQALTASFHKSWWNTACCRNLNESKLATQLPTCLRTLSTFHAPMTFLVHMI